MAKMQTMPTNRQGTPIDKIIELVNENLRDEGGIGFPRIVSELPKKMKEQRSDLDGVKTEWCWQNVDQFDSYYGELAYKLDDGRFLIFEFCG